MIYPLVRPLIFTLPPEAAHAAASFAIRAARPLLPLLRPLLVHQDPRLERRLWGLRFPNPIGLAAGFDKYARHVQDWPALGFGFAEIGTFTALAQPGNPRPRVWRYPRQGALINRFGFNNPGAQAAAARLAALRASGRWPAHPVGINLCRSKLAPPEAAVEDYLASFEALHPHADYIAVNVSSPNTPGLRDLQAVKPIRAIVAALVKRRKGLARAQRKPLLVKFAPDLAPKALLASCDAALAAGADGLILTNTTLTRPGLGSGTHPEGGLSGAPLQALADERLALLARHTRGRVGIIGVGGVANAEHARRKLELGASLVQIYTAYIFEGPGLPSRLCRAL